VTADLICTSLASLDGFIADERGAFDWAAPDEEVHAFVNDLERPIGTYLLGRRMYEVMKIWDTLDDPTPAVRDYAEIWRATDKIVYSRTLEDVSAPRTRLERNLHVETIRRMKASADRHLSIGGPELAGHAIRAGLVDEWRLFLAPVVVGAGTPCFPRGARVDLALQEQRRFGNGMVYLRYRPEP
jgi:dihydrofolate reductase